jgi:hypothetical protein
LKEREERVVKKLKINEGVDDEKSNIVAVKKIKNKKFFKK